MKKPLVAGALLYALGIAFSYRLSVPTSALYALSGAVLLLCLLTFKNVRLFNIFLSTLVFLAGAAGLRNSQALSQNHISRFFRYKKNPSVIKGFVANQPFSDGRKTSFVLRAEVIKHGDFSYACEGDVLVQLRGALKLGYGEELILRGKLVRPFFGREGNDRFMMKIKTEADLIRLHKSKGFMLKQLAFRLKGRMEEVLFRHTSSLTQGILGAVVLGEKRRVPRFIHQAMMKTGTLHLLVVSGHNVGIVGFMILSLLKSLGLARRSRFCIAALCLAVYCLMTGASTPVVRATLMATFFLLSFIVKREPDIRNSLALAFLFILFIQPRELLDAGFQLSFASVASLVYFYPPVRTLLKIQQKRPACLRYLLDSILVSLSCWLATMGFIIHHFRMFSPVTVLANLMIVPLASFLTLCGFALTGIGGLFPALAPAFGSTCDFLVLALVRMNAFLVELPMASFYLG